MLDILRNRQSAMKYVLGVILALIALSMVITMIPNFNMGGMGSGQNEVLATVGDERVTLQDAQFAINNALRGRTLPPELMELYVPQIVDRVITERAMYQQAADMGLKMSPEEQAEAIRAVLASAGAAELFDETGKLRDQALYEQFVQQRLNTTVRKFEEGIAKQALIVKMQNMVADAIVVPPQALERDYHIKNDKVRLDYVSFKFDDIIKNVQVTQADIDEYWNGFKGTFKMPGTRSLEYVVLDSTKLAGKVQVPEADLRAMYNQQIERFRLPVQVHARHILLQTQGGAETLTNEQKAAKKRTAEDVLKQLRAGGDFAKLAEKYSDDKGSAVNGGDLGTRSPDEFVANFKKATLELKKGAISDLVETEFGYHIVQVIDRTDARVKPFEEVRNELALERSRDAVNEQLQRQAAQLSVAFSKSSEEASRVAGQLGLQVIRVENVTAQDPLPEIGVAEDFNAAIASVAAGTASQPITLGQDKVAVARVTKVTPERQATQAEVLDRVKEGAKGSKAEKEVRAKQNELQRRVNETKDLAAAAKAMGLAIKTSEPFTRMDSPADIGNVYQLQDAFEKPVGTIVGPINNGGQVIAGVVKEKIAADMSKFGEQRADLLKEAKERRARERGDLFAEGILSRFQQKGRIKRNEEAIKRLARAYRTS